MESFRALEDILEGDNKLVDFQTADLARALHHRDMIFLWDTGIGKTYMAAALMKAYANEVPNRKFIFVGKNAQLSQTPRKLHKLTGMKVLCTSAAQHHIDRVLNIGMRDENQILFITHEALLSDDLMRYLYLNRQSYYMIVIDEAHRLSNFTESMSAFNLRAIMRHIPVAVGLTATPVTTSSDQIVDLVHMFQPGAIEDIKEYKQQVRDGFSIIEDFPDLFYLRTRRDLGIISNYRSHIDIVEPHPWQVGAKGEDLLDITRGEGSYNQRNKLIEIINKYEGLRGLVFVRRIKSREWLEKGLEEAGIKFGSIHGEVSKAKRDVILEQYAKREISLILTSSPEALDLPAEFIVFYEYTADVKQMLGRADRGLNPKTLDIHFMFTRNTGDADFFIRRIYNISLWIHLVLKQDYRLLLQIGRSLNSLKETI